MPFQTKITRARLVLGPFTAEDMQTIGGVLVDSISDAHPEGIQRERRAGQAAQAGAQRSARLSRLQGRARLDADPRLGLDRAHHAVAQGQERQREPRP